MGLLYRSLDYLDYFHLGFVSFNLLLYKFVVLQVVMNVPLEFRFRKSSLGGLNKEVSLLEGLS